MVDQPQTGQTDDGQRRAVARQIGRQAAQLSVEKTELSQTGERGQQRCGLHQGASDAGTAVEVESGQSREIVEHSRCDVDHVRRHEGQGEMCPGTATMKDKERTEEAEYAGLKDRERRRRRHSTSAQPIFVVRRVRDGLRL